MKNDLYLHPNDMRKNLDKIGYKQIKLLTPSTCIVNLMEKDNEEFVVKFARRDDQILDWMKTSIFTEKERLEKLKGYDRVPQIRNFYDLSSSAKESSLVDGKVLIDPYILEKEFVHGSKINPKILSKKDRSQIEEIVETFHSNGIANLDIAKNNFIKNPDRGIVMIDVGGNSNYSKFGFEYNVKRDLLDLKLMLQ